MKDRPRSPKAKLRCKEDSEELDKNLVRVRLVGPWIFKNKIEVLLCGANTMVLPFSEEPGLFLRQAN